MKSFTLFTMKSKQVWMKSKPNGFDEIKSVLRHSPQAISSALADFIHEVDLFRRKTDLTEKTANFVSKLTVFSGGRGWIRTIEARRNRFTVCPLWPLGNSSGLWSWWWDSNPRPADYKSAALPIELHQHIGGSYRARTCDILLVRQTLSQLS